MKKNLFSFLVIALLAFTSCKNSAKGQNVVSEPVVNEIETPAEADELLAEADEALTEADVVRFLDLEEPDVDGKMHKLSEYVGQGQWVLIDFWASWCGPCRAEMPNVVAAYQKYHSKGFNIVGLSFDQNHEAWTQAIHDLQMPWIHLSDLKGWHSKAAEVYGVNSIPASLLVNPSGVIVAANLRGEALGQALAEIFGE